MLSAPIRHSREEVVGRHARANNRPQFGPGTSLLLIVCLYRKFTLEASFLFPSPPRHLNFQVF